MNIAGTADTARGLNTGKRAERGVILFCSLLFILYQCVLFSPLSLFPSKASGYLSLDDFHRLGFISGAGYPQSPLPAAPSCRLSPFFFRPLPINSCSKPMLMSVKGIGPSLADEILRSREQYGPFHSGADLVRVPGIGSNRSLQFTPFFDFSHEQ